MSDIQYISIPHWLFVLALSLLRRLLPPRSYVLSTFPLSAMSVIVHIINRISGMSILLIVFSVSLQGLCDLILIYECDDVCTWSVDYYSHSYSIVTGRERHCHTLTRDRMDTKGRYVHTIHSHSVNRSSINISSSHHSLTSCSSLHCLSYMILAALFILFDVSFSSNVSLSLTESNKLSCLFLKENCDGHLTDLTAADKLFWNVCGVGWDEEGGSVIHTLIADHGRCCTEVESCQTGDIYGITVSRYITVCL